jgi:hypothetical protein
MNIPDLLPQYAQPLEVTHHTRWLDLLRNKSRTTPIDCVPPLPSSGDLRTLVAVRPEQLQAADELVRRRYAWRGYHLSATEDPEFSRPGHPGTPVTLLAQKNGRLLGTLTVRPHSPLFAEETYGTGIERLRREGHRIGEVVKLAVESGVHRKGALDALVQSAYLVTRVVHDLTDVVIEINPRHVRFYQRVLGFVELARGGVCSRVDAPSVLMRLDLERFGQRVQGSGAVIVG